MSKFGGPSATAMTNSDASTIIENWISMWSSSLDLRDMP
jgi:hypothetical protein